MRKFLTLLRKPADLNTAAVIKIISDWTAWLKKLSPFAGTLFVLLNLGTLLKKRASVITLLVLAPLLIITGRLEVLRVIFAIALFWIFLEKFSTGIGKLDRRLAIFLCLYSLVILLGIFVPSFYKWDGSFRYKFILESHNAVSILVFFIFIYLCETLLQTISHPAPRSFRVILIISIFALIVVFLFIKARLYLGLSFGYLSIIAFKRWRRLRILGLMPIAYAAAFIVLSLLTRQISKNMDPRILAKLKQEVTHRSRSSGETGSFWFRDTDDSLLDTEIAAALLMNQRVTKTSTTGRWQLIEAFMATFRQLGWKKFLYSNNVENYMYNKRRIPYINVEASSLTENTYCTTLLSAGITGLALLLYMTGIYIGHFIRRKELLSLAFFALLLAVWFFEESTMFTFSLMAHLFALCSINRIEKEDYEGRTDN